MKDNDKNGLNGNDRVEETDDDDIIELTDLIDESVEPENGKTPDPDAETIIAPPSYYDQTVGVSQLLDDDDMPAPYPESVSAESNDYEETIGIGQLLEEESILDLDEETIVAPPAYYEQTVGVGKLFEEGDEHPSPVEEEEEDILTLDEETMMDQPDLYEQTIGISKLLESEGDQEDLVDPDGETLIAPPDAFDETIGFSAIDDKGEASEADAEESIVDLDAETILNDIDRENPGDVEDDLDEEPDSEIPIDLEKIPEEDQITEPLRFTEEPIEATETKTPDWENLEEDESESLDLEDIIEKTTIDLEDIFDLEEAASPIIEREPDLLALEDEDDAVDAPELPLMEASGDNDAPMDPEKEKDLLDLLEMNLDGELDGVPDAHLLAGETETEAVQMPEDADSPEEKVETVAAFDRVDPEAFEAALERVVKKVFAETIESVLLKAVEKVVSKEIQKLKDVLIADTSTEE